MTKQLNIDQLDRLAEIKEEILVLLGGAACQPLVRDLLHSLRQGQYAKQQLHNHHAGDHRCLEGRCRHLVFVAFRLRSAPFYAIEPNSRALSFAAFKARARNSARVIGPFC